jgi:NAD-dependent dihydropyrimidine dehydrogenase PreA subunit
VTQVGNTSLKMAGGLVRDVGLLSQMAELADRLRKDHCMLAASDIFKKIFLLELSFWGEGMPWQNYQNLLKRYGLNDIPEGFSKPQIQRASSRDIDEMGTLGLHVIEDIGQAMLHRFEGCTMCGSCLDACPQAALSLEYENELSVIRLNQSRCAGVACRRCEGACPEKVMELNGFFLCCKSR